MLIFNPKRMFVLREIQKPHSTLVKAGISAATATKLLNWYCARLTVEHLEKMCVMLNCTPNDLFEWRASEKTPLAENHPLNSLQRTRKISNIREMLKDMPVEKLSQVENLLQDLKNQ